MKCVQCKQYPPTLECKDCFKQLCYNCEEKSHNNQQMMHHVRVTMAFRAFQTDYLKRSSQYLTIYPDTTHPTARYIPSHPPQTYSQSSQIITPNNINNQSYYQASHNSSQYIQTQQHKSKISQQFFTVAQPQSSHILHQHSVSSSIIRNNGGYQSTRELIQDHGSKYSSRREYTEPTVESVRQTQEPNLGQYLPSKESTDSLPQKYQEYTHPVVVSITPTESAKIKEDNNRMININHLREQLRSESELFEKAKQQFIQQTLQAKKSQQAPKKDSEINVLSEMLHRIGLKFNSGQDILDAKIKEIEKMRDHYNTQLVTHKSELTAIREKYESQILELEDKLVQASEQLDQLVDNPDLYYDQDDEEEEELDIGAELEIIEKDMQQTTSEAIQSSNEINLQLRKYDEMIKKVNQTNDLQVAQVSKMDEIIQIFKLCQDEMSKEKQLLLLDNEKLVAEVEIFEKFLSDNSDLFNRIGVGLNLENECDEDEDEEEDENQQN